MRPRLGRRQQVRVRLDAEPDPGRLRLVGQRPRCLDEALALLRAFRVARERVEDLDPEFLAGPEHVAQPGPAELLVQRRMAAHAHAAQAAAVEQPARVVDLRSVGVEVLEEALHRADLDVLEPGLGQPAQRLFEAVRLEADRRAGLDPGHGTRPSSGSFNPQTSRWNSTKPSG